MGYPVGLTSDGKKSFLRGQCHRREPRIHSSQEEHHRAYNFHRYLQHCLTILVELYRIVVLVEDGRVLKRDGWWHTRGENKIVMRVFEGGCVLEEVLANPGPSSATSSLSLSASTPSGTALVVLFPAPSSPSQS